ncbi:MAG: hypothetical protein A2015_04085 [Spirochaetes bacterium GWF1_31_7]|nr:MAG: hypothetical protein A2Y30_14670 [Spirochaetes bacterium GWE1_32_154]OHD48671.1 MAG: hypothetical protein A2015_04085 [Spirochaetes bacterium GWF1_31_7]OHD50198.1 MAG: hypothetical protein A2Y29_12715 [Spirochaetes bacterium GWE2_31_10]OHD82402.1 MAG: hypothetical protein A2355_01065 [Spirochaetes bacterium RIFOXYB1_FULL_32_8]HBD94021.1 hypothetical protein [Spirochaetia bacterium]
MKKRNFTLFILIVLIVALTLMIIFINKSLISVRLYELSQNLEEINNDESGQGYMDVLFKYEMNRRMYSGKMKEEDLDLEELKILSTLSTGSVSHDKIKSDALAVLPFVNSIRFILGKDQISYSIEKNKSHFDIAYYYERNGYFKKALDLYNVITGNSSKITSNLLLHKAYCFALTGDTDNAEKSLTQIISKYRDTEIAITAATLLMHIRDFRLESEKILQNDNPTLENSIKLLQLTSFNKAFEMLGRLQSEDKNTESKIKYYKARYYEETGDKNQAIELYQDIIINDTESQSAVRANRRIFLVSISQPENKELRELTFSNNELLQDDVFDTMRNLESNLKNTGLIQNEILEFDSKKIEEYSLVVKQAVENLKKVEKKQASNGSYSLSYFNRNGEIKKIENYNKKGNKTGFFLYIYNSEGNRIRIDAYDKDGVLLQYY